MTPRQYVEEEHKRLQAFHDDWIKQNEAEGDENWPMDLSFADWQEQRESFEAPR